MIEIQNNSSNHPKIDHKVLITAVSTTLDTLKKPGMDITLRLTNDAEMRQLNQTFRGIAKTTDVLAFNQNVINPETSRLYLGDIVISVDQAMQQAPENDHSLDEECAFLAIHGTLHLLGYDHYEPDKKTEMWQIQDQIFQKTFTNIEEKPK